MHFLSPDSDDSSLAAWVSGTRDEREKVLEIAWQRHREELLCFLKDKFSRLAWQDCEDFADDAFVRLWRKLEAGEFEWKSANSLRNYLKQVSQNDACDFVRKCDRHEGKEAEIATQEEFRSPDSPYQWMVRMEAEALRKSYFSGMIEQLISAARAMKPAQRSVGVLMADCFVSSGRWPSNERLLEILNETEPDLKLVTVKERRREVLVKFRPILNSNNNDLIW